jgi:hypothetical protein
MKLGPDALCVAIGLFLYGCALRDARLVRRLRRQGIRTEGFVVANIVNRRERTQAPVIQFYDHQGLEVEFTPAILGAGLGLANGRRVGVVYLPGDSRKARVWMRRHRLGPMAALALGGTIFLGLGLWLAFG